MMPAVSRSVPAQNAVAVLHVAGITKWYGEQRALADVSFDIRRGEILGLIGPNGSGKTTLLETVAGLLPVDAGSVLWQRSSLPQHRVLGKYVCALSKGYARRLMLALALLTPHPVVLMDEPFDGFDIRQTREMMTLMRRMAARGRTFTLAIHQLTDAERVCDRFILLADGRVCGAGSLGDLRARIGQATARLEDVFLALT